MLVMLESGAYMPVKAHMSDAGFDLRSPEPVVVPAKGSATVNTRVHVELPEGTVGMLKSKSGLSIHYGITSEGVIDAGYTGAIRVRLYNHSHNEYFVVKGDKITQLVVLPLAFTGELEQTGRLEESERGSDGFGSTGR